eukprot:15454489-Alexandrium_andersonii.AAC.1
MCFTRWAVSNASYPKRATARRFTWTRSRADKVVSVPAALGANEVPGEGSCNPRDPSSERLPPAAFEH